MSATPNLERKLLTLYGELATEIKTEDDTFYSIERGYAGLNARVHQLQLANPELVLHSASHSCVLLPHPYDCYVLSITIVYSGTISQPVTQPGDPPRSLPEGNTKLEDSFLGHGTVYKISL